jgi:hypothetical protein
LSEKREIYHLVLMKARSFSSSLNNDEHISLLFSESLVMTDGRTHYWLMWQANFVDNYHLIAFFLKLHSSVGAGATATSLMTVSRTERSKSMPFRAAAEAAAGTTMRN